jgi:hypothetical protein
MDKLAQERGLLNKLREKSNITGKILESLNPEFQSMMERLRTADEKIRAHAENLKANVRSAKSLVRRRDYLAAAVNVSAFHERCRYIAAELEKFKNSVDMKHYKFLLDQFDDEQKEQLFGYDPTKEIQLDETNQANDVVITAALKKRAGLSDWWFKMTDPLADVAHNLTNERGVAMRALEKRFSIAFLKDLKKGSIEMVEKTERFLQFLLATFKRLATALAKRNVDQYIRFSQDFIKKFAMYHKFFVDYYQKSIAPLKQQHEKLLEEQRKLEEDKSRKLEEDAARKKEISPITEPTPFGGAPGGSFPKAPEPQAPTGELKSFAPGEEKLTYEPEEEPFNLTQKKSHKDFIGRIEILSKKNDPGLLAREILNYSAKIEDESPEESLKLLSIAEGIIEDYKKGGLWDLLKPKKEEVPKAAPVQKTELVEEEKPVPLV